EEAGPIDPTVVRERIAADRQRGRRIVVWHEVNAGAHRGAVVRQGAVAQRQRTFAVNTGAEVQGAAVGNGQVGDRHRGVRLDVEHALGVVAADRKGSGTKSLDGQGVGDVQ